MSVEPKKWGVIYNPKAGTRKVKKRWKEIKEYMDSKGVDYDYVQSEGFGSVERLAGILANNGYTTIVVVGGDGALRCRLLDMGLIPHTKVALQKIAPMGDPIEIQVRGYELTLRVEEAQKIEVEEDAK